MVTLRQIQTRAAEIINRYPIVGAVGLYGGVRILAAAVGKFSNNNEGLEKALELAAPAVGAFYFVQRENRTSRNHPWRNYIVTAGAAAVVGACMLNTFSHQRYENETAIKAQNQVEHVCYNWNMSPGGLGSLSGLAAAAIGIYARKKVNQLQRTP